MARTGGLLSAAFTYYDDRDLGRHDFRKVELEAQQYLGFFNKRRVIALRARTELNFTNGDQTVPFYLKPWIGGPRELRGFRNYRFYDDNVLVLNAEYRWEAFSGLDMALFFDAGQVAAKKEDFALDRMETAAGFGFRFNIRNATFLRLDCRLLARGHEDLVAIRESLLMHDQRNVGMRLGAVLIVALAAPGIEAKKFYDDDPLWKMPPPLPAPAVKRDLSDFYDYFLYTFANPAERKKEAQEGESGALGVNTLGEVPDSRVVHQPHRSPRDDPRRAVARPRRREATGGRRMDHRLGQERGPYAGVHDPGCDRRALPAQIRPDDEPRDGLGGGPARHSFLLRSGLQRSPKLHRSLHSRTG